MLTLAGRSGKLRGMPRTALPHYATLGLDRHCTPEQIRAAYRLLAKQHHPDLNPNSAAAVERTQAINEAYEILSQPASRQAYDRELDTPCASAQQVSSPKTRQNLTQDVHLRPEEFLRGVTLEVRVGDPGNPAGSETYPLVIPPGTAPGSRFRLTRPASAGGGCVQVKTRVKPDFRFKVRGSDVRCDLRIKADLVIRGGIEMLRGVTGAMLRLQIPRGIGTGDIIRLPGEGLPKSGGRRGDLLVRILYRPEVRITRTSGR